MDGEEGGVAVASRLRPELEGGDVEGTVRLTTGESSPSPAAVEGESSTSPTFTTPMKGMNFWCESSSGNLCLQVSMASATGSWCVTAAPFTYCITRPTTSSCSDTGGSERLNRSRQPESRKALLYLLSTEPKYLATG